MNKYLRITVWVLILSGIIVLWSFANDNQHNVKCKSVAIKINTDDDLYFVTREDVMQLIYDKGDSLINQPVTSIDVNGLERVLKSHPSVSDAQLYCDIDGDITIEIDQRKPIARIFNYKGDSYYMDINGKLMPLSENYTSRVLVVTGNIHESYASQVNRDFSLRPINDSLLKSTWLDEIYRLARYVHDNEFWKSQIVQINIEDEIELIPRVGSHRVIFGEADSVEEKFERLFIFYREGLPKAGWNKYETVNLKFKDQVVCTKAKPI